MTAEAGDERQVEVEHILQPLDGGGGLVGEHLDKVGAGLVAGGLERIVVELLDGVLDLLVDLGSCEGAVDARCGFGGVAAEET